jgi:hypothetical protein
LSSKASPASMRAPEAPSGWPIAIAPPFDVHARGIKLGPLLQALERLSCEGLVELDDLHVAPADPGVS